MDKCPGLIGGLNDPSNSCNIKSAIDETIFGALDALPGNNPLGAWGVAAGEPTSPSSAAPVESSAPAATVPPAKSSTPAAPATSAPAVSAPAPVKESSSAAPVESSPVETSSAGGEEPPSPTVVKTVGPAESSTPVATVPTVVPTTETAADGGSGGSYTLITSYVSETTVIWTTVTAGSPTSTPTTSSSVAAGWSYYGCYSDSIAHGDRVMSGIEFADIGNHEVTNTKCVAYCDAKGYSMAGTEYGGQCFCANKLISSSKLDEGKCDMACEGDGSEDVWRQLVPERVLEEFCER